MYRPLWDCNRKGGKDDHWGSEALFKLMIKEQCEKRKYAMIKEKEEKVKKILRDNAPVETASHEKREGDGGFRRVPKDCVRFRGIIDRMYETFKRKNADYGNSFSELYEECGMTYAYGHMREKLERVRSLMKNEAQVKGESMKDSLYDLANYAVLTIMEIERSEKD